MSAVATVSAGRFGVELEWRPPNVILTVLRTAPGGYWNVISLARDGELSYHYAETTCEAAIEQALGVLASWGVS